MPATMSRSRSRRRARWLRPDAVGLRRPCERIAVHRLGPLSMRCPGAGQRGWAPRVPAPLDLQEADREEALGRREHRGRLHAVQERDRSVWRPDCVAAAGASRALVKWCACTSQTKLAAVYPCPQPRRARPTTGSAHAHRASRPRPPAAAPVRVKQTLLSAQRTRMQY